MNQRPTNQQPLAPTRAPWLLILPALALGGCIAADNDRHVIGRDVAVESIEPWRGEATALPDDGPSLTGADRSNWPRTEYLVPIDATYHYPQYTFLPTSPTETDRQRGIAASPMTALELDQNNGDQAGEAFAAPVVAGVEVLAMIPRMFCQWPWVAVRSPDQWTYQRSRGMSEGSLAEDGAVLSEP
jgi:hypothetical protein